MDEPERPPRALADGARRLLLLYAPLLAVALGWAVARVAGFDGATILGWLPGALSLAIASWFLLQASRLDRLAPAGRRFWRLMAVAALLIAPATKPLTEASLGGRKSGPVLAGAVLLLSIALLLVLWGLLRLPTRSRSSRRLAAPRAGRRHGAGVLRDVPVAVRPRTDLRRPRRPAPGPRSAGAEPAVPARGPRRGQAHPGRHRRGRHARAAVPRRRGRARRGRLRARARAAEPAPRRRLRHHHHPRGHDGRPRRGRAAAPGPAGGP